MVPDKTFPVVHGTVLTLSCKDGHQMNGDKEVTCIVGTEFSYSDETHSPECGKNSDLVFYFQFVINICKFHLASGKD